MTGEMPQHGPQPPGIEVLQRFCDGDRAAFAAIVQGWQESLFRIAYRIVGDCAAAEDIRQNVLMIVLKAPAMLPSPDRFGSWIRRCTINEAMHYLRRRQGQRRMLQEYANHTATSATDPQDSVAHTEEARQLDAALCQLKPDERALLSLRFDEGLTFQEIATVLDSPASTVKSQMARLVEQLRTLLGVRYAKGQCHAP